MIKVNRKDLSLEPKVVSMLSSSSSAESDTTTKTKDDDCKVKTNDCTLDTFATNCICLSNDFECANSTKCEYTVSGGDICCAVTVDDDSDCSNESEDVTGCILPDTQGVDCAVPQTDDGCVVSQDCAETEVCVAETTEC